MAKKKDIKNWIIFLLIVVASFFIYTNIFSVADYSTGVYLSPEAKGLYQHSGVVSREKLNLVGNECLPAVGFYYWGSSEGYIFADISTIKTATHTYKFEIINIRREYALSDSSSRCSPPTYNAKVYEDNLLIDFISFERPQICSGFNTQAFRNYSEINVVFRDNFEHSTNSCSSGEAQTYTDNYYMITSKYEPKYPADTIKFNLSIKNVNDNNMTLVVHAKVKYDNYLADLSIFQDNLFVLNKVQNLNQGDNFLEFVIGKPVHEDFTLVPKVKLYIPTSNIQGINTVDVYGDVKYRISPYGQFLIVNKNDYEYYRIGDFTGDSFPFLFDGENVTDDDDGGIGDEENNSNIYFIIGGIILITFLAWLYKKTRK